MDLLGSSPLIAQTVTANGQVFTTNLVWIVNATATSNSTANLYVGMSVTGGNVGAGNTTYIQRIVNSTAVELTQQPAAGNTTGGPYTFAGDVLKMALIKFGPTGTYDRTTTNYGNLVTQADEGSGTGYTANGVALTIAQMPEVPDSNTAVTNFSPNPSWTTATLDVAGAMIYTTALRVGRTSQTGNNTAIVNATPGSNLAYHCIGLYDFGGEQKVTAGTLTVNMPTANGSAAVIRVA